MRIGIASDHAGKELKTLIVDFLKTAGHEPVDFGVDAHSDKSVDYPDYAAILAREISSGKLERAIAICGTGIGMCITANKFPGVRAASVWDEFSARMSRAHNDANVMCIGARVLNEYRAMDLVKLWVDTPFAGDRHIQRVNKIKELEKKNFAARGHT